MDIELFAAKEQLHELRDRWQCLSDAKLALSMFLQDSEQQQMGNNYASQPALDTSEDELLTIQQQIDSLEAFIASQEGQQTARVLSGQEAADEANNRLSLALANCLSAREAWDARVRAHDARLARDIATCDDDYWYNEGDLIQTPLDMPPRPASPVIDSNNHNSSISAGLMESCGSNGGPGSIAGPAVMMGTGVARAQAYQGASSSSSASCYQWDAAASSRASGSASNSHNKGKDPAGAHAAAYNNQRHMECAICFDSHPMSNMVAAVLPTQVASSSSAQGHFFCCGCMRHYVKEQVQARRYPVCCPTPSCQECLAHEDVVQLLSGDTALQVYDMLVMEQSIDASLRTYCPYKDCSCLLERPDADEFDQAEGQDMPFECPSCHRVFCLSCGVTGWHTGMTCQQFQTLPAELRSVEDAAMLRMAAQQAWKRCPAQGCGHIVERTEGCNHMRCRCGIDFCYACGKQYQNSEPTAENAHGTPSCQCPLFAVPEEPDEHAVGVPAAVAPVVLRRGRPWRNGRQVSRTRCWHSASIEDCPRGDRCWFWHDEDDE